MTCVGACRVANYQHTVQVQKPRAATADSGGHVDLADDANWTTVGTRRAKFTTRGGAENYRFNQVQAQVSHLIELRYDGLTKAIGPEYRLKYQGRVFQISAAYDVDELHDTIRIEATEQR